MVNVKLNRVLMGNAIFSLLCGIDLLFFSDPIAEYMGGFSPVYLQVLGVGLVLFAAFAFWTSRQPDNERIAYKIVLMDRTWVGCSVLLVILVHGWFSSMGLAIILAVAAIVAMFSEMQYRHIKSNQIQSNRVKSTQSQAAGG